MYKIQKMLVVAGIVVLGGCATGNPYSASRPDNSYPNASNSPRYISAYGVVDSINPIASNNSGIGIGTVIGGVVGGVLGNQVGGGNGKSVATAAGAVGGAMVGHEMEKNRNNANSTAYQIGVRLDNGNYENFNQAQIGNLRVGDRVRIDNGRVSRY